MASTTSSSNNAPPPYLTQIHVRPYRNSDFEETRKTFLDMLVGGRCTYLRSTHKHLKPSLDESPFTLAMQKQFTTPLSLISYSITLFGLLVLLFLANSVATRNIGIVLSLIGPSTFFYSRYTLRSVFNQYRERILTGDLADIGKHYHLVDTSLNGNGNGNGDVATSKGKSGFWVAEAVQQGGKPEVVGCVGLDANTNKDETSAELRRLVISPKYRRRGIAQQLIRTVVQFAHEHEIQSIFLTTSSYQQPAINMYKKLGFDLKEIKEVSIQMQTFKIYAFNLNVDNYKV
ncbi:hypothetical protein CVT25_014043 [Psilocybe cyanescens]|uniref:N-acetyltransferase domain-containing protein n=1 Tax=Psilocybe cyanescens TaxID=93625 RepID=A0A409XRM8_PSICY|nr:hypothetical protein CVT25_014043 [Psilocybe cyanescens]